MWEDKIKIDARENYSNSDGRRIPIFSKDKQQTTEINELKVQMSELRRDKDLEVKRI